MKQYCRYCANMVCGDANYCTVKGNCYTTNYVKAVNMCRDYKFCSVDALGENTEGYKPKAKKVKKQQCEGQLRLF